MTGSAALPPSLACSKHEGALNVITWHTLRFGLRSLFRKEAVEQELDEELRHYVDQLAQEKVRAGMCVRPRLSAMTSPS